MKKTLLGVLLLALPALASAQAKPEIIVLKAARLFDGTSRRREVRTASS